MDPTIAATQTVPTTLEEAHKFLELHLDQATMNGIDRSTNLTWMNHLHHGLGRFIRNTWQLWIEGSPLRVHLESLGLTHPDDMSGVILNSFWCRRHGIEHDMKVEVEYYRKYWSLPEEERYGFATTAPVPTSDPMLDFAKKFAAAELSVDYKEG